MRKFKVKVTIEKQYEIEIDDKKIDKNTLDNFERYFYDLDQEDDRIKSMANDYCRLRARGFDGSIEGYGFVFEDGKIPAQAKVFGLNEEDISPINFRIINDDTDPDIIVREVIEEICKYNKSTNGTNGDLKCPYSNNPTCPKDCLRDKDNTPMCFRLKYEQ